MNKTAPEACPAGSGRDALAAMDVQNHFLGRLSHEMRNTLATIQTAAYCLVDDAGSPLTPKQVQLVKMITRNAERQRKIVENMLDLSRLRSGKLNVRLQAVDVGAIIADIVNELRLATGRVRLQAEVAPSLPPFKGDPDLITQVLRNLIDNASRYAKELILVKAATAGSGGGIRISVADDGAGIPKSSLGLLFTPFMQTEGGHGGTGLGLAICKEIVKAHHGDIRAENVPGRGACFSFTLPATGRACQSRRIHK